MPAFAPPATLDDFTLLPIPPARASSLPDKQLEIHASYERTGEQDAAKHDLSTTITPFAAVQHELLKDVLNIKVVFSEEQPALKQHFCTKF